jgi:hypothetical protein
VGHQKALEMTLRDCIKDVNDAACSGPSCCSVFSQSTGTSTNSSEATIHQHTLKAKALLNIKIVNRNYTLENDLLDTQDKMAAMIA